MNADSLKNELVENSRVRVGLCLIAILVLTWVSLVWSDFNLVQYKTIRGLEREKSSLAEIESIKTWRERADLAKRRVSVLESELWRAETEGLAMAKLQSELGRMVVKDDFSRQTVKVGTPQLIEEFDQVSRVRARLAVTVRPTQLIETLRRIDSSQRQLAIEQLSMKKVKGRWSVVLMVSAYFVIGHGAS